MSYPFIRSDGYVGPFGGYEDDCADEQVLFALSEGEWPFRVLRDIRRENPKAWVSHDALLEMIAAVEACFAEVHEMAGL